METTPKADEFVRELSPPEHEELDKYEHLPPSHPESPPNEVCDDSDDDIVIAGEGKAQQRAEDKTGSLLLFLSKKVSRSQNLNRACTVKPGLVPTVASRKNVAAAPLSTATRPQLHSKR